MESLWWDSHKQLLQDFEEYEQSVEENAGHGLERKELEERLHKHQHWLLELVQGFKPASAASGTELDAPTVKLGSHTVEINNELKTAARDISKSLDLHEVQSYLVLTRYLDERDSSLSAEGPLLLQNVTLAYFVERQSLLKCLRLLILMESMSDKVQQLCASGLEENVRRNLEHVLSRSSAQPLDPTSVNLWADEVALEQILLLDVLFLLYSYSLSVCRGSVWKELLQMFQALVFENRSMTHIPNDMTMHVRSQALFVLIEGLNFQTLLTLVHKNLSFSEGEHGFISVELQELDALICRLDPSASAEYAPLLIAWAAFICLVSTLPDQPMILDIEHAAYAQQAIKCGAYSILADLLCTEEFKNSDVRQDYQAAVKTFMSACLAAYDFNQAHKDLLNQLINLLSEAFIGQEDLCTTFWVKESAEDAPIRDFLYSCLRHFPYQIQPLARLLSCLCTGAWPAECVYDFLSRPIPVTFMFRPTDEEILGSEVLISSAIQIPKCSGLYIPAGASGHILLQENDGVLVRWQCEHTCLIVLLTCINQWPGDNLGDVISIVALLNGLLTSNTRLSQELLDINESSVVTIAREDGRMDKSLRMDVVSSVCFVIKNLLGTSLQPNAIAESVSLLQKFADSCPEVVMTALEKTGLLSTSGGEINLWKLEQSFARQIGAVSTVIDVAISLIERGVQKQSLTVFVLYVIDNLLANHVNWKFSKRHEHWYLFSKIYHMIHKVLRRPQWEGDDLRKSVLDEIMKNTIFHGVLFHVLSLNAAQLEELFFNGLFRGYELDALFDSIYGALELVDTMLLVCTAETDFSNISLFCQALFRTSGSSGSPVGIIASYLHFQRCRRIQIISSQVMGKICEVGQKARPQAMNVASFISGGESRKQFRLLFSDIISQKHAYQTPALFDAVMSFLISATLWQPGMVDFLFSPWDLNSTEGTNVDKESLQSEVLTAVWNLFETPGDLSTRHLEVIHRILALLVSLWQGGTENFAAIQVLRTQKTFWETLSSRVVQLQEHLRTDDASPDRAVTDSICYRCQASMYQVMAYDMFIQLNLADPKLRENGYRLNRISPQQTRDVLRPCISYNNSADDTVLQIKVQARALSIGLLVKALHGYIRGMDASFVRHLLQVSSQLFQHPSFNELLKEYCLQGYRHDGTPEQLVMNDFYHNLVLEMTGIEISNRHFQEIAYFLVESDLDVIVLRSSKVYTDDASQQGPYDVKTLSAALGLEVWEDGPLSKTMAQTVLRHLEELNHLMNVRTAQLSAVDAFTDHLKIGTGDKSEKTAFWTFSTLSSLIEDVCRELERAFASKEKLRDCHAKFQASLSRLLAALLWQFVMDPEIGSKEEEQTQLRGTCLEAIKAAFGCMRLVQDKRGDLESVKSLFECVLTALEVASSRLISLVDGAAYSLSHLQMLCTMVGNRKYRRYALATINTLIRYYFDSSTSWIPVLQTHFPTKTVVSTVALVHEDDVQICGVVMSFCLYLSRFKAGAEMLFGAGFLQYILLVNHELREDYGEGPFSMSKAKSSRQVLWSLGVATMTSFLRALGDNDAYQRAVMDSVFSYFRAERHKLLRALGAPSIRSSPDGRKTVKYQRAQTSSAFLQEAQYVAALLCELVHHPLSVAGYLLRDELVDFRETVLLLLSYIAREGLVRSTSGESMVCPPVHKQELVSHAKSSTMGSTSAWFLLTARGASLNQTPSSPTKELAPVLSASQYTESIAIRVYKLVNLLLRFLIIQVRQALQDVEEGRTIGVQGFPELPAPEILHALQDQVMLVTSEMTTSKASSAKLPPVVAETCSMLLSTLEKCLYLESCISRICGLAPVSMRVDDFTREMKALIAATKEHESLSSSMVSVMEIASLVYPSSV